MKILITGSNGMLGHDLIDVLKDNHELILTTSSSLDITDKEHVFSFIKEKNPDIVINSAAYTNVDGCEENVDLAFAVNGEGPKNLALGCKEVNCPLVHVSTDYVFNGKNTRPWVENDEIGPISIYGKSKLEGEIGIQETIDNFFIIRTAWLYGLHGNNFVQTMLSLAENHDEITVVDDQIGSPTYSLDLAVAITNLLHSDKYGIYHVTNEGECSWYDFAKLIFELSNVDVNVIPVSTEEFPRPAPRPHYSVLDNKKWNASGFVPMRDYKEALGSYLSLYNFFKRLRKI